MKKLIPLLLLVVALGSAEVTTAQNRPKSRAKRAFAHNSESGKGKNNRARFRRINNILPTIDLTPHKQTTFKTAKANKHYRFSKAH